MPALGQYTKVAIEAGRSRILVSRRARKKASNLFIRGQTWLFAVQVTIHWHGRAGWVD